MNEQAAQRTAQWSVPIRWISSLVILGALIAIVQAFPLGRGVEVLRRAVQDIGFMGFVAFGVVYVVAALLFVPGSALTLVAGAIFGLFGGTAVVLIASTTAAAVAFLVARHLARNKMRELAGRFPKFDAVDRAIGEGGWKMVALLRLSPAIPFSAGNYLFGLTPVRFWPYVLASGAFMLPGTFLYVYLGHAGVTGLGVVSDDGGASGGMEAWKLGATAIGLLATVAITVYVTLLARRELRKRTSLGIGAEEQTKGRTPASTDARPRTSRSRVTITALAALVLAGVAAWIHVHKDRLAGLFGPPFARLQEAYPEKPAGPTFDHSALDALLKRYVDGSGAVDYRGLKNNAAILDRYVASLAKAPFGELGRNEKLALLINAYNAFTLQLILEHFPTMRSIQEIPEEKWWNDRRFVVAGNIWSLNQIKHEQIRPKFKEPRIHFALVCAARGCPPLRTEAYTGGQLEAQLEEQATYVHGNPTWFRWDEEKMTVNLTRLYQWYRSDFEQVKGTVLEFAARYNARLQQVLESGVRPEIRWLDYDWALNSQEGKQ